MRQVVIDSLHLFGITSDQLLFLDKSTYEFERITVLGALSRHPVSKSPLAIEILEALAAKVPPLDRDRATDRIYVTRRGSNRRNITNEDAVIEVLGNHGYRVVAPQELTVAGRWPRSGVLPRW